MFTGVRLVIKKTEIFSLTDQQLAENLILVFGL